MTMETHKLASLSNHLATFDQLSTTGSQLDGVPIELERILRFQGSLLTQAAGLLLHLSQDVIAQAIVIFNRFYVGPEGGSFLLHGIKEISSAVLYLVAKLSTTPLSPRSVINVYEYLVSKSSPLLSNKDHRTPKQPDPRSYTLSESEYASERVQLMENESVVLRHISYTTRVVLPHPLALTYIQTLFPPGSAVDQQQKKRLAERTLALLNTALCSPQLVYLTHQPHILAVAAIYLAARETGVRLSNNEWWLVWDVTREELGFLVLALQSVRSWVDSEHDQISRALWTVPDVQATLRSRKVDGASNHA